MRLQWQIIIFYTGLCLAWAEVISSDTDEVFLHEKQLDFDDLTLYNETFIDKENAWLRKRRAIPGTSTDPNRALRVLTFNIQNYFSRGRRHGRDDAIVRVRNSIIQCVANLFCICIRI